MKNIFAAIDLGSNSMKLKIVQYYGKKIHTLESISKHINIGADVHKDGYISHESMKEITSILEAFKSIMDGYEVKHYRAVATSAFRLAKNGRNVIEVILKNTEIKVEIIEDTIEKHLTYLSIRDNTDDYKAIRTSALLVEMNTGSCDISVYNQNKLILNEEFILGSLVLKNTMKELELKSNHYPEVIKELIISRTSHIWHYIKFKKIKHFMAIGGEANLMRDLIFDGQDKVSRQDFYRVYDKIIHDKRSYRKLIEDNKIDWYEFVATVLIYEVFFSLVATGLIIFADINLRDGLIADMISKKYKISRYSSFENDSISLARAIAKRYRSLGVHCRMVERNALVLFKTLRDYFFLDKQDEKLLKLGAILHEIGKFTRMKDYRSTSFDKIRNLNIIGMTQHDMLLVAYICRYMNMETMTYEHDVILSEQEHNLISKLSSILTLADALDKSKTQKILVNSARVVDDELWIDVFNIADATLEEWEFEKRKKTFINTFGLLPVIMEV